MNAESLLVPVAVTVMLLAAGCGSGEDEIAAGNPTDRAFVAEMVPHHESAVEMAEVATERATSPFVKRLAADIVRTQGAEISAMRAEDRELAGDGVGVGELGVSTDAMGMAMDTGALRTATPFDPAFLDMMLPHHAGAVTMARIELDEGADPELKALARAIIGAQEREIRAMRANR